MMLWRRLAADVAKWCEHYLGRTPCPISLLTPAYRQYEVVLESESALQAGVAKRVTFHIFRRSPATQLIDDGYDIRTVMQELLGHLDLRRR